MGVEADVKKEHAWTALSELSRVSGGPVDRDLKRKKASR